MLLPTLRSDRWRALRRIASSGLMLPLMLAGTPATWAQHSSSTSRAPACPGGDGDLKLPAGFCATVFADRVGHARHMAVAPDGTLYVNTWSGRYYHNDTPPAGGFIVALRDGKGNGKADAMMRFGATPADGGRGGTGIAVFDGMLYAEEGDAIVRYRLPKTGLAPSGKPEVVLSGMPMGGDHPMHPFVIDPSGHMFIDMGSATNSCQAQNRMPNSSGLDPCRELETRGGTWRYDARKLGQRFSPAERFATGLRNGEGFAFDSAGRLFATQHGRDQLAQNFHALYTVREGADLPAEEVVAMTRGADFGWPECYFDQHQAKLVLAPEYGGDGGKKVGVCASKAAPVAAFPGHWAPNDLAIYTGRQFPAVYRDVAFIAFHGSWNRAPLPQGGYNVVAQPMANGRASGPWVTFADGFAGDKQPGQAKHRPSGLAVAPDGALYVSDDVGGRIWRITFVGDRSIARVEGAPSTPDADSRSAEVLPPEGIHADAGREAANLPVPPGATRQTVALGDRIFHGEVDGGTCAGCHGASGKGTPIGPSLVSGKWLWGDGSLAAIRNTVIHGVPQPKQTSGAMPPLGGAQLSEADVNAVAAYVWAIAPDHRK